MFGRKREEQQEARLTRLEGRILRMEDRISALEIQNIPTSKAPTKRAPKK